MKSSAFYGIYLNIIVSVLYDHVLLQMLLFTKKGRGGRAEVNGQILLKNPLICCQFTLDNFFEI